MYSRWGSRLLSNDKLVEFGRSILIISTMSKDGGQTPFDHLFRDVAMTSVTHTRPRITRDPLVLVTVCDGDAFTLLELPILGFDVINQHMDSLANESFSEESAKSVSLSLSSALADSLFGFVGPVLLLGIGTPGSTDGGELNPPLILGALGDNAQLIRAPDPGDGSFERVPFGR